MTRDEKIVEAARMRGYGLSYRKIAFVLAVAKSSVMYWLSEDYRAKAAATGKRFRECNAEEYRSYLKAWRTDNPDAKKQWDKNNKSHVREYANAYQVSHRMTNLNFRISGNLRSRFRQALVKAQKSGSAIRDLGCSITDLISRFNFFWPEYTWDNYGVVWEIDHIRPLKVFDLTNPDHVRLACNFANLRPMAISENRAKNDSYDVLTDPTARYFMAV